MGTRGFVGFVVDGTEKIAYNHFDSYPRYLGFHVASWAQRADKDAAREAARALRVVCDDNPPSREDIERLRPYADAAHPSTWYGLLRTTQGNPQAILDSGYIEDASDFPADSLFAEWGYLVNFDSGQLEIYQGFQTQSHHEGRFANRPPEHEEYWPVKLVATFPIDKPDYNALYDLDP